METSLKEKDFSRQKAAFDAYLKSRRMRRTAEREAILRRALAMPPHFNVDGLHSAMEEEGYHVSVATVYNTLEVLCEAGLFRKLSFGSRQATFESTGGTHFHLVCTGCGKVREVREKDISAMLLAKRYSAFTPEWFSAIVYGECSTCARKRKKILKSKK